MASVLLSFNLEDILMVLSGTSAWYFYVVRCLFNFLYSNTSGNDRCHFNGVSSLFVFLSCSKAIHISWYASTE